MGKILLYYKYVQIENPEVILNWQKSLCNFLGLKGRIIIANEGINGTVGGEIQNIEQYKKEMNEHPLFNDIDFKESDGGSQYFPKLKVVIKKEIVHLGLDTNKVTVKDRGIHLSPEEAHELIEKNTGDLVILDTRNDYESRIGTFKNALIPNTKTFREFPKFVDENLEKFKNKQVLMFCTGGVRCERASAYLNQKKIAKKVYQISGGIHRYVEKFPNGYFIGKNYVFDGRVSVKVTDDVLAICEYCKIKYDEYTNCINAECNRQIIVCPSCIDSYHNTCSSQCLELVKNKKVNIRKIPHKINVKKSII